MSHFIPAVNVFIRDAMDRKTGGEKVQKGWNPCAPLRCFHSMMRNLWF